MRKIFSTVLVATALLFSMQANAIDVANETALRNAINKGAGATIDITLTKDIALDSTLQIYALYNQTGETINLNLNGFTLKNNPAKDYSVIELFKGTLNISNGTVKCTGTTPGVMGTCKDAIIVHGIAEDVAGWSTLNIKKDAKVISDKNAITMLEFVGIPFTYAYSYVDDAYAGVYSNFTYGANAKWNAPADFDDQTKFGAYKFKANVATPDKTKAYNAETAADGYIARSTKGTATAGRTNASGLSVPKDIDYTSSFPEFFAAESSTKGDGTYTDISKDCFRKCGVYRSTGAANGAKIVVEGYVYGEKYGIKVNGALREAGTNIAQVIVESTAEVACSPNTVDDKAKDGTAVYCSGNAKYTIKGYVHGNIGVVVKGGDVTLQDATVVATGKGYEAVTPGGSGMNGGSGCGVIIDSQLGYAGNQKVTIAGDTKITGDSGFGIQEVIPNGASQVIEVKIDGGTIVGGDLGAMNYTKETTDGNKVTLYGATVQGETSIGGEEGKLDDLKATGTFITEMTVGEEVVLIVTKGEQPSTTEYSINAESIPSSVIIKGETVTLDGNKTLGYVEMPNETQVTVPAGKVLKVTKLVMGDDASIIVEPGATVIVSGEQGIVAGSASNLVLKADATGMGTFVLNPAVTSNRSPMATVQYYAKEAKCNDANDQHDWNIFASPFLKMTSVKSNANTKAQYTGKANSTWFEYWDGSKWALFSNVSQLYNNSYAFQAIAITNNTAAGDVTYTFTGKLQGNNDGSFTLSKGFNYIGNGYTAQMTAKAIIDALKDAGADVQAAIYLWDAQGQGYTYWDEDDYGKIAGNTGKIGSTNMIVIRSNSDIKINLNYNELIWNQYKNL